MREMFMMGGLGMWPTLLFGAAAIAAAVRYALRPSSRYVPLVLATGTLTLFAGLLGFATGVTASLLGLEHVGADRRWIGLLGLGESMMNVNFALGLLVLAALAMAVGAFRLAHGARPDATA